MSAMASAGGRSRAREVRILHFGGGRAESLAPGAWPPSPPAALLPTPRQLPGAPCSSSRGEPGGGASNGRPAAPHVGSNWSQAPRSSFRQNGGRHHCYHHHHHQQLLQEPCRQLTWRPPPQRVGAGGRPRARAAGRRCSAGQAAGEAPSLGYVRSLPFPSGSASIIHALSLMEMAPGSKPCWGKERGGGTSRGSPAIPCRSAAGGGGG